MVEIPRTDAFEIDADRGYVFLQGSGVALTMSPETAMAIGDLLIGAAIDAIDQQATAGIWWTQEPT